MNVAVYLADQNPHRDRTRGVTNFTHCLLSGLAQRTDMRLVSLVSASSYAFDGQAECVRLPWRTDNAGLRLITDNLSPLFLDRMKPDVAYYPKGYVSYLMRPRCPVVGTVHDTILQFYADHYPGYRSRLDLSYWIGLMKASLKRFDMVLAVSCVARDQILELCDRYRITPPQIRVTYEASDYEDVVIGEGRKNDYVVHFASEAPHKNTRRLLELWSVLSRERPSWPQLKLIASPAVAGPFLNQPGVSAVFCVDSNSLSSVLREARAVLLPSQIEGFGLPALEGYYHGTPVCFIKGTSVDEILSPFTTRGGFCWEDPQSFQVALDGVLGMSREEVIKVRDGLHEKFSRKNFVEAVAQALRAAGTANGAPRL